MRDWEFSHRCSGMRTKANKKNQCNAIVDHTAIITLEVKKTETTTI